MNLLDVSFIVQPVWLFDWIPSFYCSGLGTCAASLCLLEAL